MGGPRRCGAWARGGGGGERIRSPLFFFGVFLKRVGVGVVRGGGSGGERQMNRILELREMLLILGWDQPREERANWRKWIAVWGKE